MHAPQAEIPAYTRHKRTGLARVRIDGKDHYLGAYDTSESKAKYAELVKRHVAKRVKADVEESLRLHTDVTINELVPPYLVRVEGRYRKGGKATSQALLIKLSLRVLREK